MDRLTETTVAELQRTLETVDDKKSTLRLVAAIAYKNGVTQSALADWLDVERKTIYNWLTRLEGQELETAVQDKSRTGRPRKLTPEQRHELETVLRQRPIESGVDGHWWTTERLQQFIQRRYEVAYSASSCRRLMKEAGLEPQSDPEPSKAAGESSPEEPEKGPQSGRAWGPS